MWSDPPPVCQRVVGMESNTFILLTIYTEWEIYVIVDSFSSFLFAEGEPFLKSVKLF